jgi:hypothetical protein
MAEAERVQLPRLALLIVSVIVAAILIVFFTISSRPLLEPVGTDVTREEIKRSAVLPVFMWCFGWPIALARYSDKLQPRFAWALGCAWLFVHIAVAFHLGHGWSHEAAWEHTRQVGGYGNGIFVNYAFALVWLADVLWVWIAFGSYLARPQWLNGTIHGFLAFVVVNAAFVFGSWGSRLMFVIWFLAPIVLYLSLRGHLRRQERTELANRQRSDAPAKSGSGEPTGVDPK